MTITDCLVRLSPHGEPYFTKFDLSTGKTVEDLHCLRPLTDDELFHYKDNTSNNYTIRDAYYDAIFKYKDILMVINYFNSGFILVSEESTIRCSKELNIRYSCSVTNPVVQKPVIEVGCVLSPILTFDIMQPAFKMSFFEHDGRILSLTRFGLKQLNKHKDIVNANTQKVTPAMLLDNSSDNYAGYFIDNKINFIKIGGIDVW